MTIDVSDNNPRINYSIAEGVTQTVFSVPFEFFEDSNVYIYVDGVLKTEGLDYTLTGGDGSTGTLTFVTATPPDVQQVTGATGGTVVSIVRHVELERVTDFVAGQDINRAALNEQLDTIVAQIADLDDKVDRTIHLSDSEVAPSMLLTEDRKGRVLAFDATTGDVEAGPLSNDIQTIADNIVEILDVNNQAAAAAASATASASSASSSASSAAASASSATDAAASKTAAAASETAAASSEANAASSASNAASSETAAASSETNAASSATASAASASAASSSASAASTSETNAAASETNAAASETAAAASETNAAASESAAATSATNAATSESNAATSASTATTQATNAATSASAASTSASNAATSETNAASSASSAASSASSASASADAALSALDSFDDRYLGQKTSDPTLDNDGDALVAGALYFNTTDEIMKVYDGSLWVAAYASLSGAMFGANNLSDVASASDSRNNLGLGTAATTASTDYATAAQGSLADSALQSGDNVSALTNDAGYTTNVGDITGVTAGSGITGGGTSGTVTINHADTSSQASVNNSGRTYIQDITLDTYGHITGITSATETVVYTAGAGLNLTGTAFSVTDAPKWTTARTLSLTGDASGSVSWDGSGNASLSVTIADNSHNHTSLGSVNFNNGNLSNVNHLTFNDPGPNEGLEWIGGSGWKIYESPDNLTTNSGGNLQFVQGTTREMTLNTAGSLYTAAQGTLWGSSNDGSGSGLDADLLDGQQGSYYYPASNPNGYTTYTNSDVDTHLNTGTATTDQVLSWNGSDYDWIDAGGGSTTAGDVGTYAFLISASTSDFAFGSTLAGSSLRPSGVTTASSSSSVTAANLNAGYVSTQNTTQAGTWRCMGRADYTQTGPRSPTYFRPATLWIRIS